MWVQKIHSLNSILMLSICISLSQAVAMILWNHEMNNICWVYLRNGRYDPMSFENIWQKAFLESWKQEIIQIKIEIKGEYLDLSTCLGFWMGVEVTLDAVEIRNCPSELL